MKRTIVNVIFVSLTILLITAFLNRPIKAGEQSKENRLDAQSIEVFVDKLIQESMDKHKIPGTTLAITYKDNPILIKSYGVADLENSHPVDSQKSEFAIASISKLFTYMGLYQLYEQGKVQMDDDVQKILGIDFESSDSKKAPVYVRDLFTHSAGFEDSYLGQSSAIDAKTNISLDTYVKNFKPNRFSTGDSPVVYNNYSTALAGAVIEKVSGMPFTEYMEKFVLAPLDMKDSLFHDSVIPTEGDPRRAVGYFWNGKENIPQRIHFHHGGLLPLAGLKATTSDMAKFIQYHLSESNPYSATRLIGLHPFNAESSKGLPIKTNHPNVGGNAFGFWVDRRDGLISYSHSGNTKGFKSKVSIYPELGLGIFISTNSTRGSSLANSFATKLVAEFFSQKLKAVETAINPSFSLDKYQGLYLTKRRNDSTIEKLVTPAIYVQAQANKLIVYSGANAIELIPIGENKFKSLRSGEIIRFDKSDGDQENRTQIIRQNDVFEKIKGWQDTLNYLSALNYIALVSLVFLILKIISYFRKRQRVSIHTNASNALSINALGWLIFFGCLMVTMTDMKANYYPDVFVSFPDIWTVIEQVALAVGLLALIAAICFLPKLYRSGDIGWLSKLGYSLFIVMTSTMFVWSNYFNVIGFRF